MESSPLQQRIRQFLVHSFLYYKLHETVISDRMYDELCRELRELLQSQTIDKSVPFAEIVLQTLGKEDSGFTIKSYPPSIVSTAIHLLYQEHYRSLMTFPEFLSRLGYSIQKDGIEKNFSTIDKK